MVKLVHISDLHFGPSHADRVSRAVLDAIERITPDAVICSGDLVEWAELSRAWKKLRAFLDGITVPTLVVPGNHDLQRFNLLSRLLRPWQSYHRFVHPQLDRTLHVPGAVIVGLGTPRRWSIDLGHISRAQLTFAHGEFAAAPTDAVRVVVLHHGLRSAGDLIRKHVWGSARAARRLLAAGTHLVLSGHRHFPYTETVVGPGNTALVWAQAGTAASHRFRRAPSNSISVVRFASRANTNDSGAATPPDVGLTLEWWYYNRTRGFEPRESREHRVSSGQERARSR